MKAFFVLNYVIYTYYVKRRDSVPLSGSFFMSVVLIGFNVFSIWFWLSLLFDFIPSITKIPLYSLWVLIALINYILLYHRSRYKSVFADFAKQTEKHKLYNQYVLAYIITSSALLLATLIAADVRVDGHL